MQGRTGSGGEVTEGALFLCMEVTVSLVISLCASEIILGALNIISCKVGGIVTKFISVFTFLGSSLATDVRQCCGCRQNRGKVTNVRDMCGITIVSRFLLTLLIFVLIRSMKV